jgi:hypothetical protein
MTPFRFRLDRVLEWYEDQLQREENRLAGCRDAVSRAQRALDQTRTVRSGVENALLHSSSIPSADLRALETFRLKSREDEKRLIAEFHAAESKVQAQLSIVKLANQKVRLLEKLRERRRSEHTYAVNRELEELAADTYLARFNTR